MLQKRSLLLSLTLNLFLIAWYAQLPTTVANPAGAASSSFQTDLDSICNPAHEQIGGVISGTLGEQPTHYYCIATEDLIVPEGQSLTIGPATWLYFGPGRRLIVAGQLFAHGNDVASVQFTDLNGAGWAGIHFLPSAGGSACTRCAITNINPGGAALRVEAPLTFQWSEIRNVPGGAAIAATVPFSLANILIENAGVGLEVDGQSQALHSATHLTLSGCQKGIVNFGQRLALDNSIMAGCTEAVSTQRGGVTTVSYSLFHSGQQDFVTEPGAQLVQGPGLLFESPQFARYPDYSLKASSPAVNAANPQAGYSQEPGYNGGRADLGAFGNTPLAPERPPTDQVAARVNDPVREGQPGETITFTLMLENNGPLGDIYTVGASPNYRDEFTISGIWPDRYSGYPTASVEMPPHARFGLDIGVKIPLYATRGMVHMMGVHVNGTHGAAPAELALTTVVSPATALEHVGQAGFPVEDIFVQGNYAYLAAGRAGLRIVDIAEPARPVEVGAFTPPADPLWAADRVTVQGNYAYIAAGPAGLRIIDISAPARPVEVGRYQAPGRPTGVKIVGNYAYLLWRVCDYPPCLGRLILLDISNPARPALLKIYGDLNARDIDISGNYAYLAAGADGLHVLDISNPAVPVEVGYLYIASPDTRAIKVINTYAYLLSYTSLKIVDLSDPTRPVELDYTAYTGAPHLAAAGHYLYLTGPVSRLEIFDISTPTQPVEVPGEAWNSYQASHIQIRDNLAYLAAGPAGLHMVDISQPAAPEAVSSFGAPGFAQGVAVADGYAYVADRFQGLRIFDIAGLAQPVEVAFYRRPGGAQQVAVKDHYAYVTFGNCDNRFYRRDVPDRCEMDLSVLDVSNPAAPVEVGGGESWQEIKIWGDVGYVLDRAGALRRYDLTHPAAPVGLNAIPGPVSDYELANGYLYLLTPNNFRLTGNSDLPYTSESYLKILDPISLAELSSYRLPEQNPAVSLTVAGQYAYIYWYASLVNVHRAGWLGLDVSDPAAPAPVEGGYQPVEAQAAAVAGPHAYLADGKAGLRVLDLSNPSNPVEVDAFGADGLAMDVAVAGDYIYLANGPRGLNILRYPTSATAPDFSFKGKVSRGEVFEADLFDGLTFGLEPDQFGWTIWLGNKAHPEYNFSSVVTPPYYGINSLYIEGWHFRNSDNTGPNEAGEKNVNAPQHERGFCFVLNEADYQVALDGLNARFLTSKQEQELAQAKRAQLRPRVGVLMITQLQLGNLVEGAQAWIEDMEFEVELQLSTACELY